MIRLASFLLAIVATALARDVQARQSTVESGRGKVWREAKEALEKHQRWYLPPPFEDEKLAAWAQANKVDEDIAEALNGARQTYRGSIAAMQRTSGQRLLTAWAGAFEYDPVKKIVAPRPGGEVLIVLTERPQILQAYANAENALFNAADAMSPPEAKGTLRSMRHDRIRELFELPSRLPGTDVDLPAVLRGLNIQLESNPTWAELAESFLNRRDVLLRERHDALQDIEFLRATLLTDAGPGWQESLTPDVRQQFERELADLDRREFAAELPLRRHVRAGLESFLRSISPDDARRVRLEVLDLTHPTIFDDEREFEELLKTIAENPAYPELTRDGMKEILVRADRRLAGHSLKQVDATDRYLSLLYELPDEIVARLQTEDEILRIQSDRRKILRESAQLLSGIMGADDGGQRPRIDEYLTDLKSLSRASDDRRSAIERRLNELLTPPPEPEPAPSPQSTPEQAPAEPAQQPLSTP